MNPRSSACKADAIPLGHIPSNIQMCRPWVLGKESTASFPSNYKIAFSHPSNYKIAFSQRTFLLQCRGLVFKTIKCLVSRLTLRPWARLDPSSLLLLFWLRGVVFYLGLLTVLLCFFCFQSSLVVVVGICSRTRPLSFNGTLNAKR